MVGRCCCLRLASITFITRVGFSTSTLAYVLDSLVRVSRRVGKNHFGKIAKAPQAIQPPENMSRRARIFCGCLTSFCLTTQTKTDVSPSAPSSPCGANKMQWLDNCHWPTPRINFYRFLLNDFKSFDSLFKVLFIFPSQYLFAIGFPYIFSLGRSLSPA